MPAPTITIHICDGGHKPLATVQVAAPITGSPPAFNHTQYQTALHEALQAFTDTWGDAINQGGHQ